jgi:phosphoribosylaminoimidazolecarboxamide formyltransferase/IMP cyclohydrolase
MSLRPVRRALLSVSDKSGLAQFARELAGFGVELISTGGTFREIGRAGVPVREVSEVTGFPEMLDGRVKTLHPIVHAGILHVRGNAAHEATVRDHAIGAIDLVVVNLYPFEATVAQPDVSWDEAVENIDVGGPTMIRAAAKNHDGVTVVTGAAQYQELLDELRANGGSTTGDLRRRFAAVAFARTAAYDAAIAEFFAAHIGAEPFPARLTLAFERRFGLRYGENPHQSAAFYAEPAAPPATVATAEQLHGKELSYNNILDLDSAWNLVAEFADPAAVIVKHNNPCGAATAAALADAFRRAHDGDPVSAFGGIIAVNRSVDAATAELIAAPNRFTEAIIAPAFDPAALELITTRPTWKKSVRLLRTGGLPGRRPGHDLRRIGGGLLVQNWDQDHGPATGYRVVSRRPPTDNEHRALAFAWLVCKHVKSNAIVLARGTEVVGVGAGQMSRIDSTELAVRKAAGREKGAVLASDAFFPFRDNVDAAAKAGVSAIIQPGGSVRDEESVAAADEHGLAMVFTGTRHFRH